MQKLDINTVAQGIIRLGPLFRFESCSVLDKFGRFTQLFKSFSQIIYVNLYLANAIIHYMQIFLFYNSLQ